MDVGGADGRFLKRAAASIAAQRLEVRRWVTDDVRHWHGTQGSKYALDEQWVNSRGEHDLVPAIVEHGVDDISQLLASADDHAHAIEVLLRARCGVMTGLFTLQRAAMEAMLRVLYLLDPDVSSQRTILRFAAYQLERVEGALAAIEGFGPNADEADVSRHTTAVEGTRQLLERAGFVLQRRTPANRRTRVIELGGERETVVFNATDASRRFLPNSDYMWNLTSGAVHGHGWMLPTTVSSAAFDAMSSPAEVAVATVSSLLDQSLALVAGVRGYVGLPEQTLEARTRARVEDLLAAYRQLTR